MLTVKIKEDMAQEDSIPIPNELLVHTPASGSNDLPPPKKKRNLPGNPDPEAEVIALSPKTLLATNRFPCEICGKGFQRDQNLQLHRRGHNLPWKLKQRSGKEARKRVYVCPEETCVHHHPSRALGDLTGVKKHFCRKHGDKKWKCERCGKKYAVKSDWKAHSKTCGTREYKCDCGTVFSRRDSFITHRAFCDALAEEAARLTASSQFSLASAAASGSFNYSFMGGLMAAPQQNHDTITSNNIDIQAEKGFIPLWMSQLAQQTHLHHDPTTMANNNVSSESYPHLSWAFGNTSVMWSNVRDEQMTSTTSAPIMSASTSTANDREELVGSLHSLYSNQNQISAAAHMSATALLQKAAQIGATSTEPLVIGSVWGVQVARNGNISDHQVGELVGYGSNSTTTTTNLVGSDVESTANEFSPMCSNTQMEINPLDAKRRRVMQKNRYGDGGQTRDFLGVGGVESICHPSSVNGWI